MSTSLKKCFISSLFSDSPLSPKNSQHLNIDIPGKFPKLTEFDYFLFTNIPNLEKKISTSWTIKHLNVDSKHPAIIKSRYPKFQGWKLLPEYDIIIYCDAYLRPINQLNIWTQLVQQTLNSPNGLVQSKHPIRNCPYAECLECITAKKDTKERLHKTIKMFEGEKIPKNCGLWENVSFCYHTKNVKVQTLFDNLWKLYDKHEYTYRDQPLYQFIIYKTGILPEIANGKGNSRQGYLRTLYVNSGKTGRHIYAK